MNAENGSLAEETNHPLHQYKCGEHMLALEFLEAGKEGSSSCSVCEKPFKERDPIYSCGSCGFRVDLSCSCIRFAVEAKALHDHPLCIIERIDPDRHGCSWCRKVGFPGLPVFMCLEGCGFSLHLPCGPLPCAVQYGHGYELTLTDSLINNTGPDDVWCDVCEEPRDPWEAVYHSPDIEFTASIKCLLPQIIPALRGDLGDVPLRTVGGRIPGKVVRRGEDWLQPMKARTEQYGDETTEYGFHNNIKDIPDVPMLEEFALLTKPQRRTLDEQPVCTLTELDLTIVNYAFAGYRRPYDLNPEILKWDFRYSDDAFTEFKEQLAVSNVVDRGCLSPRIDATSKVVKFGNIVIPSKYAHIYPEMVGKYGKFSEGRELSPAAKIFTFHMFFSVVYSMRETRVRDITDDILCTWHYCLRGVKRMGFSIQFAFDNLEKLLRGYFVLKVIKFRDETTEKLEKQLEELARQIGVKEAKLGELKLKREKYRRPKDLEESLAKKCLIEAAKWKWEHAGDLYLF